ncbi:hypothetical protein [Hymenobacter crusticola]|uniref:Uncharacterized protein n=1 Tax=Hymenobacter crusticola TaxID=1770526 RepID=A0A243W590_9BACT|nr:hypothetical protein [Hymenobacter crusticola]OUJ68398.1 hypothetical protein BXP70_27985 [Hymenobacter crusticola]
MNSVALSFAALLLIKPTGYLTLEGELVPGEVGEHALQQGTALLVNGVLIGDFSLPAEALRVA